MDVKARFTLADALRARAAPVAEEVTDRFLTIHPDWRARYGERARLRGVEDARYHVTFLAAAIESGTPAAFAEYVRWTARVLDARGIAPIFLAENVAQVRDALAARMDHEAGDLLGAYVAAGLEAVGGAGAGAGAPAAEDPLALTRNMYLQAALAGERQAALTVATEALRENVAPLDIYVDVLQAALYEVGRLWETNQITVAHEHAATAITQFVAAHLYSHLDRTGPARGTLLMTGLDGELHSVGALMVADVLETRGWTVHFLGTNLPYQPILDAVRERRPDCVGISATMLYNLPAVRRLIDGIRQERGPSTRIMLGGAAFRHTPDLWRELGADGYGRDLREAIRLINA